MHTAKTGCWCAVTSEGGVKNFISGKGRAFWQFEPFWTMMQCSQMEWGPKFVKLETLKKMGTKVPKWGSTWEQWPCSRDSGLQPLRIRDQDGQYLFSIQQYENKFFYVGSFLSKVVCSLLSFVNISCRLLHCYCSYGNTGLPSTWKNGLSGRYYRSTGETFAPFSFHQIGNKHLV